MLEKKYDLCVIGGGGHVGLPLSIAFADKGLKVVIHDTDVDRLAKIESGFMPFLERGADLVLRRVIGESLFTSVEPDVIGWSEFVIVVIGTPVDAHLNPRFQDMKRHFESIAPFLNDDQTVILRSTVYPGVTKKVRDLLRKTHPRVSVCFCPERIAEGKAMEELGSLPQIVSGFDEESVRRVARLFSKLTDEIITLNPIEAELAKLFTNSWRYIQFAIANQFYMMAEEYGVDFYRVFEAMTQNYPRAKWFPSPGFAAGPCLFKDTMQLSAFTNNRFFLGHSAMLVNEGLPNFIVEQLKRGRELTTLKVGVLGMAFKGDSDDKRESLSYKLKKILEIEAAAVFCSDLHIESENFVSTEELIKRADVVIIGAPHSTYANLDFGGKEVIDVWNITGRHGLKADGRRR